MPKRLTHPAPQRPKTGIVHLGAGAFFRAFHAVYTHQAMEAHGGEWGIAAVSLRSATVRDGLMEQGCAFTAVERAAGASRPQVITSITRCLVAPENPAAVIEAMIDPNVRIVSMTITEKGYCHNPATLTLNPDHPDIQHDLQPHAAPVSAVGFIVRALAKRKELGLPPFTVLSCDNLPNNGALTKRVVLDFAQMVDPELANWIAATASFPATMVDRITPATTAEDIARLEAQTGYHDPVCVVHEPFRQWVIEDDFVDNARPAWDLVGGQIVQDVAPFEVMKLRCLNGTHSMLAYLGYLAGYETIAETVADPGFVKLLERVWTTEITPTVPPPEGTDLGAYCAALLDRYRNPAIRHRTWQIAMDGSQKLPQRLLGTIADNHRAGRDCPALTLAVAGWMRYVGGVDEKGTLIEVKDPLASVLRAAYDDGRDVQEKVDNLLALKDIFDEGLAGNEIFRANLVDALDRLISHGAKEAVTQVVRDD